jgi:hypothetical protein
MGKGDPDGQHQARMMPRGNIASAISFAPRVTLGKSQWEQIISGTMGTMPTPALILLG